MAEESVLTTDVTYKGATTLLYLLRRDGVIVDRRVYSLLTDIDPILSLDEFMHLAPSDVEDRARRLEEKVKCDYYKRINEPVKEEEDDMRIGDYKICHADNLQQALDRNPDCVLANGQYVEGFGMTPNAVDRAFVGAGGKFNIGTTGGVEMVSLKPENVPPSEHHHLGWVGAIQNVNNGETPAKDRFVSREGAGARDYNYAITGIPSTQTDPNLKPDIGLIGSPVNRQGDPITSASVEPISVMQPFIAAFVLIKVR